MPSKKAKANLDDEIDLLSSEFLTSTNNRRRKSRHSNNNNSNNKMTSLSHERALTQSILQDLEAQNSPMVMDLAPPRAWRPNPAYDQDGAEVEIGLDEAQQALQQQQVNNNNNDDGNGSDSSSNNNDEQQLLAPAATPRRNCREFLKKNHLNIILIVGAVVTIIVATLRFGFPETFYGSRTTDSSQKGDQGNIGGDTNEQSAPEDEGLVDINGTLIQTPTGSPTYWPTSWWPTYNPTMVPTARNTSDINGLDELHESTLVHTVDISGTDAINGTDSVATDDEGNSAVVENVTIASNDTMVLINDTTTANATTTTVENESSSNETISAIDVEGTGENTTSSTEVSVTSSSTVVATTTIVDQSSTVASTTEPALQSSTSTTDATTTTAATTTTTTTSTEAASTTTTTTSTTTELPTTEAASTTTTSTTTALPTTTTEAASTTTTVAAVTTPSPYICADTTSGGKIFKLIITPTTSTTSLEIFRQDVNSGEYIFVTNYNDDPLLTIGTEYINKLCIFAGNYKFIVKDSADACYSGFFRGNVIFENCGDGEYIFP